MRAYRSEADKVRDMPHVMKYITGRVADVGCGTDKIIPEAVGFDGRPVEGVDVVDEGIWLDNRWFDTIFSSHFLEHVYEPWEYIDDWADHLEVGGHLVLYMPQKGAYNSEENLEHLFNWSYEDFIFFFKRCFCGEGKNYKGEHLPKIFEIIDSGLDIGPDRYSFWLVCKKI